MWQFVKSRLACRICGYILVRIYYHTHVGILEESRLTATQNHEAEGVTSLSMRIWVETDLRGKGDVDLRVV
jgi:hypothetical protein